MVVDTNGQVKVESGGGWDALGIAGMVGSTSG